MTDQQCQSCHHQTFHRFELDHPEFRNWPRVTGPGIRFSHQSHFFKHFPHGNRPFECSQCHRDDDQGNVQQLVGYEQACGDCHQGPINLSSQAGLPWLQLPSLDVELLQAASQDVGQWPVGLSTDFEGRLSPFSQLLLMADPEASEGLTALGYQFDFLDLQPADPEHLVAARQIAWGLKRLLADLARRGTESIRHRLQIVLRRSIDDASLQRLTQNFSPTLFPDSAQHWFPHLGEEVLPDQGAPVFDSSTGRDNATASGAMDRSVSPRLVLPHDILARLIQDRADEPQPSELLSENPLAGRKTTSRMAGSPEPTASAQPTAPPTTVRPGDDGVRAPHRLPGPDGQAERQVLLAENPLANPGQSGDRDRPLVGVQPPATIPSPVRDSELSGSPAPRGSEPVRSLVAPQATADADRPRVKLVPADAFQPVGWVRNDRQYAIRYHLLGHADPWLKAWIDLLVPERASGGASELAGHVLNSLTAPDQAGNCLQCHGGS
jgi:hypothetical protein